jgi:hypothetical protein
MKEQKVKCRFCGKDLPMSKAWPINRPENAETAERVWTCAGIHAGIDEEIRRQLMCHELGPNANPDNPDYTVAEQLAYADQEVKA